MTPATPIIVWAMIDVYRADSIRRGKRGRNNFDKVNSMLYKKGLIDFMMLTINFHRIRKVSRFYFESGLYIATKIDQNTGPNKYRMPRRKNNALILFFIFFGPLIQMRARIIISPSPHPQSSVSVLSPLHISKVAQ